MAAAGTANRILLALPAEHRRAILADAEPVDLPKKRLLYEVNKPIRDVYFIEDGVASILSVLTDGTAVETSTCGREGMVGLPLYLGADRASTQAMQQIPGRGLRVSGDDFRRHLESSPELRQLVGRYTHAVMTLIAQNSACNRRHSIEERCVRWFLTSHDQMERDTFELTHQFLSQMLGVRRATVTVTAGAFQQAGLIKYHRGVLTIVNREGLEEIACECYAIIRNEYARLLGGTMRDDPLEKVETSDGKFSTVADGA
jgi:CRP-like cAMP-binding protein